MNNKIIKLQLGDYFKWNNLSREDKVKRNKQIAKLYLDKGPSILNYYNALKAYFGGFNSKNPYLITGEAPSPGWGKQGITGLHKMMAKLPETKLVLLAPLAGRSRAASTLKMEDIVKAQLHRDEVYKRWASLYKLLYDPTPTTFRTKPARVKRLETDISKSNGRTLAGGKGNAGGSYNNKSHTINVTTSKTVSAKNLEDIGFHEGIHSYGLGESPSYYWKTKYLNFPEGTNPYSLDPREIATHGLLQGLNLGIKVGQPYPGKEELIKIIENRPDGLGFGGIPYTLYNNAKTNADYRRLWSLLNGTFKDGGIITAANARKWKHKEGGILVKTLGGGNTITAKLKAKANLTKRKAPDWDNLDRGYRYLTLDMKLPHDLAIAVMGNVVEESQGNYKAALKNGRGRGLIQWDGRPAPKGRYGQWGSIWASVAKKANVYDPDTDTVKNYWAPWNGLKGDLVRLKFISAPLKLKARIYAESYLRPGKPRIADRQLSAMQLDSIYNPKIKNIVVQLKEGGTIDFLSLGGWVKNTFNNVSSFLGSDAGKSVLSIGSGLLGLGKGISNSGKITDAANEAEEAINALESADRLKSFAEKYATILLEKLSKPNIDVNGSPIHTNGVNVTNEAYNLAINTFNFDNSKYNQMRLLIKELALKTLGENSSSMIGSVGGLIDSIGGIAGSLLNKKSIAPKSSLTGNPDSSKQVITTNSGMSGTVDDWRKAILG